MTAIPSIKLFADGAVIGDVPGLIEKHSVKGFTTNPTLMVQAGVRDYASFGREMLAVSRGLPVSFEVIADEPGEMERQALILAGWGENVYVKIPVTDTRGSSMRPLIRELSGRGVKVNVTAVFSPAQIDSLSDCFSEGTPGVVSIFAGRIADAGIDPAPIARHAVEAYADLPSIEVLWASCREIHNVVAAAQAGCDIITVPNAILTKLGLLGKDLEEFSLETVRMFYRDALAAGLTLA